MSWCVERAEIKTPRTDNRVCARSDFLSELLQYAYAFSGVGMGAEERLEAVEKVLGYFLRMDDEELRHVVTLYLLQAGGL